ELDVPWEAITVVMAPDADPFRFDGELYSGGSQSVRTRFATMRRAAATARGQLVSAAAARWSVPAADCQASLGQVVHAPSGRKLGYGELAAEAARLPPAAEPRLKSAHERLHVGKPMPALAAAEKVSGRTVYGIDVRLPGMLVASIRQSPVFGGSLSAVDPAPALA